MRLGKSKQVKLNWSINNPTDGISEIFPSMKTDIVLDNVRESRRIVIDTKFTSIFTKLISKINR